MTGVYIMLGGMVAFVTLIVVCGCRRPTSKTASAKS